MRLEAERQQSEFTHERGVRHAPRLMEPIIGSLVEPRLRWYDDTHKRSAKESRLDHDRLDRPGLLVGRSRHRAWPAGHSRILKWLKSVRDSRTSKLNKTCEERMIDRVYCYPRVMVPESFSLALPIASDYWVYWRSAIRENIPVPFSSRIRFSFICIYIYIYIYIYIVFVSL